HTLFETMGAIVRMLHPIMPFLTEEIWQRLPNTEGFVTVAPYPKAADYPQDARIMEEVALLQDTVTEVRRIRGEMELAMKVPLRVQTADATLREKLAAHARALDELAGVVVEPLTDRPKGYATAVIRGVECLIPLQGVIDFQEEVKRLDKVLQKVG